MNILKLISLTLLIYTVCVCNLMAQRTEGNIELIIRTISTRYTDNSTSNSISYGFSVDNKIEQKLGFLASNLSKNLDKTPEVNKHFRNFQILKSTQLLSYGGALGVSILPFYINRNDLTWNVRDNLYQRMGTSIGLFALGFVSIQIGWKQLQKAVDEHNAINPTGNNTSNNYFNLSPYYNYFGETPVFGMALNFNIK